MHDEMSMMMQHPALAISFLSVLFIFIIGSVVLTLIIIFAIDKLQRKDAIRYNYPVIARLRPLFETLGEFFRRYFFAMDREEMPFNRADRNWVHSASNNMESTLAFGSTKNLNPPGTAIFVSAPFPTLDEDASQTVPMVIGPYCKNPYLAKSLFNISGMSFGSISKPAILALSHGAKMADCWLNTGEGGLSTHHLAGNCDIVFQIGTAKYGVRDEHGFLSEAKLREMASCEFVKMIEVKLSQGAKPGKGGILPGIKVTPEVATIRGIPVGKDSISPNRHADISNVNEILDFVHRVRIISNKPVGIKFVVGDYEWLEEMFIEIHKRGIESAPDFITVDGGDGGTGAAPMALLDNVGLPLKESLPVVADLLIAYDLKNRIRLIASGKLITPSDVAWALCVGADFINTARGFMFSLGCIQVLKCQTNTCPTGIATHNPRLQKGLNPANKAVKVANYVTNLAHEVEVIAHSCGAKEPRLLKRRNVRIMQANDVSVRLDKLYPSPSIIRSFEKHTG